MRQSRSYPETGKSKPRTGRAKWLFCPGFTLVELLAVVAVIVLLAGLLAGLASYGQKKSATARAKVELKMLELAIEQHRSNVGAYPTSTIYRISTDGVTTTNSVQFTNNVALISQLQQAGVSLRNIPLTPVSCGTLGSSVALDPWGNPFVYYCPVLAQIRAAGLGDPAQSQVINNSGTINGVTGNLGTNGVFYGGVLYYGYQIGGMVNVNSYDLFSTGPDEMTYAVGAQWGCNTGAGCDPNDPAQWSGGVAPYTQGFAVWGRTNTNPNVDDITNWQ